MSTTFTAEQITAFEHATWSRCAAGYQSGFAVLTAEALPRLLSAAGVQAGARTLDVGTGTGGAAAAAVARGAISVGVDFADAMLEEARRAVPGVEFLLASAGNLPFDDATFDALVANGVLHHLADPIGALREAYRVLTPGGRVAATVWGLPERLAAFGLFFGAVERYAGAVELPHGPLFGVADPATLTGLFIDAGFEQVVVEEVDIAWRMDSVEPFLRAFANWADLDSFSREARAAIEDAVRQEAEAFAEADGIAIPNPMVLIAANRPVDS